tara:strand:- start:10317 stop:11033 length:717 start_codon:yes stop_codon:yes gene_type:complete
MPLPTISTPTYELELPVTKKTVKYRPFLVKEEKILVIAMESQDEKQIGRAVKDVLSSCILTRGVKVDKLPTFEIEYLFLHVRGKSVGEQVEVLITCPDDGATQVPVLIDIDEINLNIDSDHNRDVVLDDNYTLRLKYPSLGQFIKSNFNQEDVSVEDTFDLIADCIDQVFSPEESFAASECTKKELNAFLEQLNSQQFKKIEKFFETMPKLKHTIDIVNPKTKVTNHVVLEGLQSFFE